LFDKESIGALNDEAIRLLERADGEPGTNSMEKAVENG
jgi:hypothetical protein